MHRLLCNFKKCRKGCKINDQTSQIQKNCRVKNHNFFLIQWAEFPRDRVRINLISPNLTPEAIRELYNLRQIRRDHKAHILNKHAMLIPRRLPLFHRVDVPHDMPSR